MPVFIVKDIIELKYSKYKVRREEDKDGNNRTIFEVVVNNAQFVESKRDGATSSEPASFSNSDASEFAEMSSYDDDDDNVPF